MRCFLIAALSSLAVLAAANSRAHSRDSFREIRQAAQRGDYRAVRTLLPRQPDFTTRHKPRYVLHPTPLMLASWKNHKDIVILLLANGANLEANAMLGGGTPLMYAARAGHEEICEILIAAGADVNAYSYGYSVLMNTAHAGHLEVVKLLVEKGAKVNAQRYDGKKQTGVTPLMIAAQWGHTEVVRFLLKKGADPDLTDSSSTKDTALMRAAFHGREEIVALLLKHGADPNLRDSRGLTALHQAVKNGTPEVEKLLRDAGAKAEPRELEKLRSERKIRERRPVYAPRPRSENTFEFRPEPQRPRKPDPASRITRAD